MSTWIQNTLITIAVLWLPQLATAAAAEPPNILFVYLDDFGWRDTGYMGSDFYETPHIDALARQGLVFTDAYSCAANCAPARGCLLSGQYTPRHKIFNVGTRARGKAKDRRLEHIAGSDVRGATKAGSRRCHECGGIQRPNLQQRASESSKAQRSSPNHGSNWC